MCLLRHVCLIRVDKPSNCDDSFEVINGKLPEWFIPSDRSLDSCINTTYQYSRETVFQRLSHVPCSNALQRSYEIHGNETRSLTPVWYRHDLPGTLRGLYMYDCFEKRKRIIYYFQCRRRELIEKPGHFETSEYCLTVAYQSCWLL